MVGKGRLLQARPSEKGINNLPLMLPSPTHPRHLLWLPIWENFALFLPVLSISSNTRLAISEGISDSSAPVIRADLRSGGGRLFSCAGKHNLLTGTIRELTPHRTNNFQQKELNILHDSKCYDCTYRGCERWEGGGRHYFHEKVVYFQ